MSIEGKRLKAQRSQDGRVLSSTNHHRLGRKGYERADRAVASISHGMGVVRERDATVGLLERCEEIGPIDPPTRQLLRDAKNPLLGLHRVRPVTQASSPRVSHGVGVSVLTHTLGPLIVEDFRYRGTNCDNHRQEVHP